MLIRKIKKDDDVTMATIILNSLAEFNVAKSGTTYFDKTTDHFKIL